MYDEALFSHILAVSNRTLSKRPFLEQIEEICKHHPKSLILREKDLSEAEYTALAKDVLAICQRHNVPCILHTYFRAAKELGCDAIHLPDVYKRQVQPLTLLKALTRTGMLQRVKLSAMIKPCVATFACCSRWEAEPSSKISTVRVSSWLSDVFSKIRSSWR